MSDQSSHGSGVYVYDQEVPAVGGKIRYRDREDRSLRELAVASIKVLVSDGEDVVDLMLVPEWTCKCPMLTVSMPVERMMMLAELVDVAVLKGWSDQPYALHDVKQAIDEAKERGAWA